MGGKIWFDSKARGTAAEGETGTTFYFTVRLPRAVSLSGGRRPSITNNNNNSNNNSGHPQRRNSFYYKQQLTNQVKRSQYTNPFSQKRIAVIHRSHTFQKILSAKIASFGFSVSC